MNASGAASVRIHAGRENLFARKDERIWPLKIIGEERAACFERSE